MILWDKTRHSVGVVEMDHTHEEFMALIAAAAGAAEADLAAACARLFDHTCGHFANETRLMRDTRYPLSPTHVAEHARILGDLERMQRSLANGRIAIVRSYLEGLAEWFATHVQTMDAALAAHLRADRQAA